ncbi:MAG: hypothetical protein KZQ83_10795 [gamma proteobacterium symbiont of Taylorina sp.]|nr:hypothetical protein [gamma proteobacterium symbiont of Taylorina sp.]
MIKLLPVLLLLIANCSYADELFDKTNACRMEIKILGPDVLEEDDNCVWLVENVQQVVEKCSSCLPQLELIREASRGNFDY